VGDTASFTVVASGGSPLSYQWSRGGTNLTDAGNISGATNATLIISNAQLSDATNYTVTVTDAAGSLDATATLVVKTPAAYVNLLENPGFEDDPSGQSIVPWSRFPSSPVACW